MSHKIRGCSESLSFCRRQPWHHLETLYCSTQLLVHPICGLVLSFIVAGQVLLDNSISYANIPSAVTRDAFVKQVSTSLDAIGISTKQSPASVYVPGLHPLPVPVTDLETNATGALLLLRWQALMVAALCTLAFCRSHLLLVKGLDQVYPCLAASEADSMGWHLIGPRLNQCNDISQGNPDFEQEV